MYRGGSSTIPVYFGLGARITWKRTRRCSNIPLFIVLSSQHQPNLKVAQPNTAFFLAVTAGLLTPQAELVTTEQRDSEFKAPKLR